MMKDFFRSKKCTVSTYIHNNSIEILRKIVKETYYCVAVVKLTYTLLNVSFLVDKLPTISDKSS